MGMRRSLLAFAWAVLPLGVHAEDHKWAAFAAVSGTNTGTQSLGSNSLWNGGLAVGRQADGDRSGAGWHVAGEVTLNLPWGIGERIAFVGDASAHLIGEDDKSDATQIVVMVGPRLGARLPGELHLFGHFMGFGAIHRSDSRLKVNTSTMALAVGAGVDFTPFNRKGDKKHGHDGFRIQVDWIFALADQVDGSIRYSFGYVHRFD
jgi:hypothetical protein